MLSVQCLAVIIAACQVYGVSSGTNDYNSAKYAQNACVKKLVECTEKGDPATASNRLTECLKGSY